MIDVSAERLIAAGVAPTQANAFARPLADACARFDISTPARFAAFLGQCMVESDRLIHCEENLYYSSPDRIFLVFPSHFTSRNDAAPYAKNPAKLANRVYGSRLGNGDELSGDGWAYRGRGLIGVTGRTNYTNAASGLARDYVSHPELVALPDDACLTAAWFWSGIKANTLADAGAIDAITKAVNGRAMLNAGLRRQYTEQALNAFSE